MGEGVVAMTAAERAEGAPVEDSGSSDSWRTAEERRGEVSVEAMEEG